MIASDYDRIKHLEKKSETPKEGEWKFYVKNEVHQTISDYQYIQPNHKEKVLLSMDNNIGDIDDLVSCLKYIFNVELMLCDPVNVNEFYSTICKNIDIDARWYKKLVCKFLIYPILSYFKSRESKYLNHLQYNGQLLMIQMKERDSYLNKIKNFNNKMLYITSKDIYDIGTIYVFGLTEMNGDASIISTYHLENSKLRLLKLLIHEFSHSLGIEHCIDYECVISGIISLDELDSHKLIPCLEDCAKIAYACKRTLKNQLECFAQVIEKMDLMKICEDEYNQLLTAISALSHTEY